MGLEEAARDMRIPVVLDLRNGRVRAHCPDLPGCSAVGASESEALEVLRARIHDYFSRSARPAPGTRKTAIEI